MGRTIHMAWAVDVDRFSDSYLKKNVIPGMRIAGRIPMIAELRAMCADARARGLEVFPPCDNTNARGLCMGHDDGKEGES